MKRLFFLLAVALSVCAEVGAQETEHLLQLHGSMMLTNDSDYAAGVNITFRKMMTDHVFLGYGFGHRAAWAGDSVDMKGNRNTMLFSLPVFLHSGYRFNDRVEAGLDVGYFCHYQIKKYSERVYSTWKPFGALFIRPGVSLNTPFNMSVDMGALLNRNKYNPGHSRFDGNGKVEPSCSIYLGITYHFK